MANGIFDGIRVVEVATWTFVPAAGAVLADFGADVIKVEHPGRGDPQRGLATGGYIPSSHGVSLTTEQTNRGKRSIGIDFSSDRGRELLFELIASADVFMTNLLPAARQKLAVDVDDVRARHPTIIYVRADATGPRGPESGQPGYDSGVFFGRGGILDAFTPTEADEPVAPQPGFGDKTGAMNIAFGVASALLHRERAGVGSLVDVSLLASALWVNSSDIIYSKAIGRDFTRIERPISNPIATSYRTSDSRWISLTMLESDRWWDDLCEHVERGDLRTDQRFRDAAARASNSEACVAELQKTFAQRTLAEWRTQFATLAGPWAVVQNQLEVLDDPQARANGYIDEVEHPTGQTITVIRAPVMFDEVLPELRNAPEASAQTEEILLELGHGWDEIGTWKDAGVIA
jgi:crotonobetainyl-CoA:carnitine CoA-transferase CaiB-like acyl-CoA transferase